MWLQMIPVLHRLSNHLCSVSRIPDINCWVDIELFLHLVPLLVFLLVLLLRRRHPATNQLANDRIDRYKTRRC